LVRRLIDAGPAPGFALRAAGSRVEGEDSNPALSAASAAALQL
jgi:hypothetical protein